MRIWSMISRHSSLLTRAAEVKGTRLLLFRRVSNRSIKYVMSILSTPSSAFLHQHSAKIRLASDDHGELSASRAWS